MRNAGTVLGIIRKRGEQGLPLEDIYCQLYNPELYLYAYGRIYSNDGAMTPGASAETVDGMSQEKISAIIQALRYERYKWTPVKRVYIPKKNGKLRPLGLPTWSDKLLQEVIRQILEAYYEPQFDDHSHGFRPRRGCHTALKEVETSWSGVVWFIEGDISQCFDKLDHQIMLQILKEKLHDNRFLRLIENMLKAGYLEDWKWKATISGSPQGGIVSPILSNIFLDRFDKYVKTSLIPQYNRGINHRINPAYNRIATQIGQARQSGQLEKLSELIKQRRKIPSRMKDDPDFRRLHYVRYADDFLLGFIGPKSEAVQIKQQIREFLLEKLKLELSEEKTLITHATTGTAKFLGYEICKQLSNDKLDQRGRRSVNGIVSLRIPVKKLDEICARYMQNGKPERRPEMLLESDFGIITQYQSEYRGIVQYYLLAQNLCYLNKLRWVAEVSLLKTLAGKHKSTVSKMAKTYKSTVETPLGSRKVLKTTVERGDNKKPLIAYFGGIPLKRQKKAILVDKEPITFRVKKTELIQRLLANKCELCGAVEKIEVHHIRKLADLKKKGREMPAWNKLMAARQRKTLALCWKCHDTIHAGKSQEQIRNRSSESRMLRK